MSSICSTCYSIPIGENIELVLLNPSSLVSSRYLTAGEQIVLSVLHTERESVIDFTATGPTQVCRSRHLL